MFNRGSEQAMDARTSDEEPYAYCQLSDCLPAGALAKAGPIVNLFPPVLLQKDPFNMFGESVNVGVH